MQQFTLLVLVFSITALSVGMENIRKQNEEQMDLETLLSDILRDTLKPFKCVTILCDRVYYDVFKGDIFKIVKIYVTFFMVMVDDSEDLLSPYNETQDALIRSKRQDCQTYIILIANGLQVARLLRFGDRYRVLDTRANFIMLYDDRLFESNLLYLWKRIVNVIFLREYSGTKSRSNSDKKTIPWFEITTVPFPSPIIDVYTPRRLDIWRQSKFRTGVNLFQDKTSDLRNQTLKIVTFEHIPAATKITIPEFKTVRAIIGSGDVGFSGLEVEILATIAKEMNFQPNIYEPEKANSELWGSRQSNGQYSGLFGEMIKSKADIALGDLYYTPFILELMDLSIPYYTQCLTFLTPEALTDNSWKTLILPFKPVMWAAVIVCIFLNGIIFYVLAHFHSYINQNEHEEKSKKFKKKITTLPMQQYLGKIDVNLKYSLLRSEFDTIRTEGEPEGLFLFQDIVNSFLYTFSVLLMVSLPKLPTGWSLRILTGCYWMYCLLVVVAYRASMTAILANPAPRLTIDTIQELVDSQLSCVGFSEINRDFFNTSLDTASQEIGRKFEIVNNSDLAIDRVSNGDFALYENAFYLKHAMVKKQMRQELINVTETKEESDRNRGGNRNLHIMENCVINMPISIGLHKNSPIIKRVNKYIRRVIEAGLVKKWLDDVMQNTLNSEKRTGSESIKALMSLHKMFGAFFALFIGYFFSLVVLFAELFYFAFYIKKHPRFDKYSKQILNQ